MYQVPHVASHPVPRLQTAWLLHHPPEAFAMSKEPNSKVVATLRVEPYLGPLEERKRTAERLHRAIVAVDDRGCGGTHLMGYGYCQQLAAYLYREFE